MLRGVTKLQKQFDSVVRQPGFEALRTEGRVHIGRSSVCDERGLFASADLDTGTFLGFYPVHAVGVVVQARPHAPGFAAGIHHWAWPQERAYFEAAAAEDDSRDFGQYLTHSSLRSPDEMFVDVSVRAPDLDGWLGHIINDADSCDSGSYEEVTAYLSTCCEWANCFNVPLGPAPLMAYVTTTRVAKGEELLTSYFPSFWLSADELPDMAHGAGPPQLAALARHLDEQAEACEREVASNFRSEAALLAEWLAAASEQQQDEEAVHLFTPHDSDIRGRAL